MTTVKEVMVSSIPGVEISTPVIEVARQMIVSRTGVIPVCDNGRFRGIITERDIVIGIVATTRDPIIEPASSVMNRNWPIVSPNDDVMRAANIMVDSGAWVLPVVRKLSPGCSASATTTMALLLPLGAQ